MADRHYRVYPTINGVRMTLGAFDYRVDNEDLESHGGSEDDALYDYIHEENSHILGFDWDEIK